MLEHNNTKNGTGWSSIKRHVQSAIVTIEEIEVRTDIDFHPDLDRTALVQNDLDTWSLDTGRSNFEHGCK